MKRYYTVRLVVRLIDGSTKKVTRRLKEECEMYALTEAVDRVMRELGDDFDKVTEHSVTTS
jgi:hypothetical protein